MCRHMRGAPGREKNCFCSSQAGRVCYPMHDMLRSFCQHQSIQMQSIEASYDQFIGVNWSCCWLLPLKWRTSLHLFNALARIKLWFLVTLLLSMIGCMHPYRSKDQSFPVPFDCWQMPSVPATSCRHKASWNVVARRLTLLIIGLLLNYVCVQVYMTNKHLY